MLKIVGSRNQIKLVLLCDYCQKVITDAGLAIYVWKVRREDSRLADGVVYTLHKGVCDHATTDSDNDHEKSLYEWYWRELSDLPGELIANLGMTWDQAQGILETVTKEDEDRFLQNALRIEQEVQEWEDSSVYSREPSEDDDPE